MALTVNEVLSEIDRLYQIYKHSIPYDGWEKCKHHFKALSADELTDEDLMFGQSRSIAERNLETYIRENLVWDEQIMGSWFYYSKSDSDLVILRKWLTK